jgi:hypothetical protein
MGDVELAVALTVWVSFGAFLFFPTVHAPPFFARTAIALCAAELLACLLWTAGRSCIVPGCPALAAVARTAAKLDIPGLTGLMLLLAAVYGLRVARNW